MRKSYRLRNQQLLQLVHWFRQHPSEVSFNRFSGYVYFDAISDFHDECIDFLGIKVDEIDILEAEPTKKPPRRVLPEHEGRYKITLPSGTTERSKQILAKKATRECNSKTSLYLD